MLATSAPGPILRDEIKPTPPARRPVRGAGRVTNVSDARRPVR
jgi:hypothetical protein